jgi:small-conductance mechanosensitive channel
MDTMTVRRSLTIALFLGLFCFLPAFGQTAPASSPSQSANPVPGSDSIPNEVPQVGQVEIEGRPVLTVYETLGTRTAEQRAGDIRQRIISIARDSHLQPEDVTVLPHDAFSWIVVGSDTIMAITDADAKSAGQPRAKLAEVYAASVRTAIQNYRHEHTWRMILRGVIKTSVVTVVLFFLFWLIRIVRLKLGGRIQRQVRISANLEKKSAWHVSIAYLGPITLALGAILRWIILLALLEAYLTVVLGFFSSTREISMTVTEWVTGQLASLARAALDYLPNLLVLAVITLVANYSIRLSRLIFNEIAKGELKLPGFYPDWADPTEKLIRMLILVLSLIVAFPYLPGAKSPAFQGISIFLGVLLSLGSSSAVANAIAGIILTYMRSFLIGDWVQIGDTVGEVIEKNLLVTRVLTPKEEIITIPNATVMSGSVKNYSVEARKDGVIFFTTVTIGYDAPWRTIHQLLTSAALATKNIRARPAPFVLQKGLDDFYVAYELNAYTDVPREMLNIFSELHQNIQDKFNEAGMEICSPHFAAVRDGNGIAIPQQYVEPDYKVSAFRLQQVNGSQKSAPSQDPRKASAQSD